MSKTVGCRHFWDPLSSEDLPVCSSLEELKKLESLENKLIFSGAAQIENLTSCQQNCNYYSYKKVEVTFSTEEAMIRSGEVWVNIMLASSKIKVKEEILIYDIESLVSDIGGALGLFLGFSVIMIWDWIQNIIIFIKNKNK